MNKTLSNIIVARANIDISDDGCNAVCVLSGQEYPLEMDYGPCGVYCDNGHVSFGNPVSLPSLNINNDIVMVFDAQGNFLLWTIERWYDKIVGQIECDRQQKAFKARQERRRQESSRKHGIYQRLRVINGGQTSDDAVGQHEDWRNALERVRETASSFGTTIDLAFGQ